MSRGVTARLRVAPHIGIGIHPLQVALYAISGEEEPGHRVIIARVVVIQPREGISILAREAFGCAHTPGGVALGAGRTVGSRE